MDSSQVSFTRGYLEVPTYTFGRSDGTAPLFQSGNRRGLYPYAALDRDSLSREPVPVQYESLTLENEYLRVVILPELGGRIWSARDKVADREIFYCTSVIKPSGYNHRGGWPVGNLEVYGPYDTHMMTWPGEPWPWEYVRGQDGSATIVLSHVDHFFRNKLSAEVTLYPGRSFLELRVKLHNKNALPNRYLLWTNAGIRATEGTRFIYPMTRTIAHNSADFGAWPISGGVDLSWYKNNSAMLGVFGLDVYDNFIGAYDYESDYGTICYTNRQEARGVKTWTWGIGEAGIRQLEHYTDSGLPYIEVQSGRFVWDGNYEFIDPGKTDGWTEYWYGTGNLGGLTTATRDIAIHLGFPKKGTARLRLASTGSFPEAVLSWRFAESHVEEEKVSLSVTRVLEKEIEVAPEKVADSFSIQIRSQGRTLLDYTYYPPGEHRDAEFASDSIPRKFGSIEQLTAEEIFQKGITHEKLGQVKQAEAAYQAALERDSRLMGPNLQLGLLALKRLQHDKAVDHFEKVLERDPSNGDAHYYLAFAHSELGRLRAVRRHYYRLLPSSGKFERRDYGLALLALRESSLPEARRLLSSAVKKIPTQISVRQAYAFSLRRLDQIDQAEKECDRILELDPTNAFARAEKAFIGGWKKSDVEKLDRACARHAQGYLEVATEYLKLSAWSEVEQIVRHAIDRAQASDLRPYPLLYYYRAFAAKRMGDSRKASDLIDQARRQELRIDIFPFRRETVPILRSALVLKPGDANAAYLLGTLFYSLSRHHDAVALWRTSIQNDPEHFSSLRDLGWALLEQGRSREALPFLKQASQTRPEHLETTTLVVNLYARAGDTDNAREVLERALEKKSNNDALVEARAPLSIRDLCHFSRRPGRRT